MADHVVRTFWTYFLIVAISLAVSLYTAESYLRFAIQEDRRSLLLAAERAGYPIDRRTKVEIVDDLRRAGEDAWPLLSPGAFSSGEIALGSDPRPDSDFFPLSGIPNVLTVSCSDIGQYLVYRSDAYGFANPSDAWGDGPLDVGIVGDEYTLGTCVRPEESIAAVLRRKFRRTASVGIPNVGPLVELGILQEYLRPHAPRVVFWLYYAGNDMDNLCRELQIEVLQKYLNPNYRQKLIDREAEIDAFLRRTVERAKAGPRLRTGLLTARKGRNYSDRSFILDVLSLRITRETVDKSVRGILNIYPWGEFERILATADQRVAGWGGQMFFVYLPSYAEMMSPARKWRIKEEVIAAATRVGLPVVDVSTEFAAHPDPLSLFPFHLPGHYTAEGYGLVAELLAEVVNRSCAACTGIDRKGS